MRHFSLAVALALSITGCGSDPSPLDAAIPGSDAAPAVDAFVPSSTRVSATAGGSVRSSDGVFTLVVPPGALASDITISIAIVPHASWPAEVAATSPVGEVYDVQPEGLAFLVPAYGVHRFASLPAALTSPEGDTYFATHRSRSADGTVAAMATDTYVLPEATLVVATLPHLSEQWFTSALPSGARITGHLVAPDGAHRINSSWTATTLNLLSVNAIPNLRYHAEAGVATPTGITPYVTPLAPTGWTAIHRSGAELLGLGVPDMDVARSPTTTGTLPALMAAAASTPLPGWHCGGAVVDPALATLFVDVGVAEGAGPEVSLRLHLGGVSCVDSAAAPTGEVFLADNTRLTRTGGAWVPGAVGALANVISETPDLQSHCRPLGTSGTSARVCTNVATFSSAVGASPITMSSSLQNVTASYAGVGYGISGATGSAVFAASDTMHVSGIRPPTTMPIVIDVTAPNALGPPASFVGTPTGLRTTLRVPDGTPGNFYVSIGLTGTGGGESFLTRSVPIADAELSGTDRLIQMLEDDMIDDLVAAFLEPSEVYVGVVNEVDDTELFAPARTAIRAGRFYQIAAADLGSSTPTDVDCTTGLPATFGGAGTVMGTDAIVATMCRSTTTCRLVAGAVCPPGTSSFARFGWDVATSTPIVTGERIDLATHGDLQMRGRLTGIPRDSDEQTEIGGGTQGYAVAYRVVGTDFTLTSIAGGPALTPTAVPCSGLPARWIVRLDSNTTRASAAGNVCSNSTGAMCSVASPGAVCTAPTATFSVRFSAEGVPEVVATAPWAFAASSHGVLTPDLVSGLPRGVDVTLDSLRSTGLHGTTVLRFDGTSVEVLSATLTP